VAISLCPAVAGVKVATRRGSRAAPREQGIAKSRAAHMEAIGSFSIDCRQRRTMLLQRLKFDQSSEVFDAKQIQADRQK
jgi:hypothetical protein